VQYRPAATGVQVSAVHPQQNWMQTLESCTLIKDQPTKRHVTLQHVQVLPLLNHHSWKQLGFKNHCTVCEMFCGDFVQHVIYIYISTVDFVVVTKLLFTLIHTEYLYTGYV